MVLSWIAAPLALVVSPSAVNGGHAGPDYRHAVTIMVTATLPRNGRFTTMTLRYRVHGQLIVDTRCGTATTAIAPDSRPRLALSRESAKKSLKSLGNKLYCALALSWEECQRLNTGSFPSIGGCIT